MAVDLNAIEADISTWITNKIGLRMLGQARDQVSPPIGVVLPSNPLIQFGATMDGATKLNMGILLIVSDGQPSEKSQRALNAYLGIGPGEVESIPGAMMVDNTLAGAVEWCIPISVTNYGRITYADVPYFGARLNIEVGAH